MQNEYRLMEEDELDEEAKEKELKGPLEDNEEDEIAVDAE